MEGSRSDADAKVLITDFMSSNADCFTVCHLNSRSLLSSFDEFNDTFSNSNLDLILITESWLNSAISDQLVSLGAYNMYRNDRLYARGGGISVYVRKGLQCKVISKSDSHKPCLEYLFLEVRINDQKVLVGCVYKPPGVSDLNTFYDKLMQFSAAYPTNLICGDFNINLLERSSISNSFNSHLNCFDFHVINSEPTRLHNHGASLLDLIITNRPNLIKAHCTFSLSGISDHQAILVSLQIPSIDRSEGSTFTYRDFKNVNLARLHAEVDNVDWSFLYTTNDVNFQLEGINNVICDLYNNFVKIRKVTRTYHSPWMNNNVRRIMAERNFAYEMWIKFRDPQLERNYKILRNKATSAIRTAKAEFRRTRLNPSLPSKVLWNNIKEIGITQRADNSTDLDPDELNNYFVESVSVQQVNNTTSECNLTEIARNNANEDQFSFRNVSIDEVFDAFRSLKSDATGIDDINPRFLKLIFPLIALRILQIFNTAITTSNFPTLWKVAKVCPIKKKDRASCPEDFRPISILPVLSKIFERLLYNQIRVFLDDHGLISEKQSGFTPKRSTTSVLMYLIESVRKNIDNHQPTVLCLLDFSKAFDSVNWVKLCTKLITKFNFSSSAVNLIYSYLQGRRQCTVTQAGVSKLRYLLSGVPQGSILGPLLFVLYINDLALVPQFCSILMYADDVQIYLPLLLKEVSDCIMRFNSDLELISAWAIENNLVLNPNKSQSIILYNRNIDIFVPPLNLNNVALDYKDAVKNLGVLLDKRLSWHTHIDMTVGRIYGGLRNLWRHADYTPYNIRLKLVKSLLLPIFTYGDAVYCELDSLCRSKINVAFNSCARYIYGLRRYDHISEYSKRILGCTLDNYYKFRHCLNLFKILNNLHAPYLKDFVVPLGSQRTSLLLMPRHRTLVSSRTFFVRAPRLWNMLPLEVRRVECLGGFKTAALSYFSSV